MLQSWVGGKGRWQCSRQQLGAGSAVVTLGGPAQLRNRQALGPRVRSQEERYAAPRRAWSTVAGQQPWTDKSVPGARCGPRGGAKLASAAGTRTLKILWHSRAPAPPKQNTRQERIKEVEIMRDSAREKVSFVCHHAQGEGSPGGWCPPCGKRSTTSALRQETDTRDTAHTDTRMPAHPG